MKSKGIMMIVVLGLFLLAMDQLQAHQTSSIHPFPLLGSHRSQSERPYHRKGKGNTNRFLRKKLIIRTHGKSLKVFGIAPRWYWQRKGITRPRIGEKVKARVLKITIPKGSYLAACAIKTRRWRIQLRDPRTGLPLWGVVA